ncbi:putative serine esterase-domain-containing protein [Aspergillus egyptiacus]|nr:putative serine esterase-domain-containing protein [Aspergillus egyptiacus]
MENMASHLCVIVHGLWGNPDHMNAIVKALRSAHPEERLHILVTKRNSGNLTYDGIQLGGERVCIEIEEELDGIRSRGGNVTKLSIVGYSLGGLLARYAVGLLESRGLLDELEPMTFTTFATPHLGVRSPSHGWHYHLWNVLGARLLSLSGQQVFTIDNFHGTGRPLLSILADPDSVFIAGLRKFKRRILYANITNDRSAAYYTTCIAKTDPYVDTTTIRANYVPGYEDVILDPGDPFSSILAKPEPTSTTITSLKASAARYLQNIPFIIFVLFLLPIGIVYLLCNATIQTICGIRRIRQHNQQYLDRFPGPIWAKEIRGSLRLEGEAEVVDEPTLALTPYQFAMISSLDQVGWRKYPVWIHNDRHSHAAIIARRDTPRFAEGLVVLRHWIDEEFLV